MTGGAKELTRLERAVLVKLLEGDTPTLAVLRRQLDAMTVRSRDSSGVGFFVDFDHPASSPRTATPSVRFGDVLATIDGLEHGAGFVLFVDDGRITMLEGYSHGEPWPDDTEDFALRYERWPRDLSALAP